MKESAVSQGTMIFHREVIGQFHCKLLLSPESTKAEAIIVKRLIQVNLKEGS